MRSCGSYILVVSKLHLINEGLHRSQSMRDTLSALSGTSCMQLSKEVERFVTLAAKVGKPAVIMMDQCFVMFRLSAKVVSIFACLHQPK